VRALEAAYQVSNSQRLRWCGFPVGEVSGSLRSRGGLWCRGVSVGVGFGCGAPWLWGKLLCPGAGRGGRAGWGLGPGSNTALKLTWLSGGGKRGMRAFGRLGLAAGCPAAATQLSAGR
jgi:hypothetical protein